MVGMPVNMAAKIAPWIASDPTKVGILTAHMPDIVKCDM